jgi:hypothetical protein
MPVFNILGSAVVILATVTTNAAEQTEATAIRELRAIGADIELDKQAHAISLWWPGESHEFSDKQLKLATTLPHLTELWLEHTTVTDAGLIELKHLKKLKILGLICEYVPNKPARITDAGLVHLKRLCTLRMLRIEDSDVTDKGLIHLRGFTKLEDLSLFGSEISDAGLVHLRGLKSLTYLDIAETQWEKTSGAISPKAARELRKHLPKCKIDY